MENKNYSKVEKYIGNVIGHLNDVQIIDAEKQGQLPLERKLDLANEEKTVIVNNLISPVILGHMDMIQKAKQYGANKIVINSEKVIGATATYKVDFYKTL